MADKFELKAIISMADKLTPTVKKMIPHLNGLKKHVLDVGGALGNLGSKIGVPFTLLSGLAAGVSVGYFRSILDEYSALGEGIIKGSLAAGMSAEEFQKWSYVAGQSAVPVEDLTKGVAKLNLNIGNTLSGKNKELPGLFRKLNIQLKDNKGHVKDASKLLPELADAFQKNTDPVMRARMGMALFGKSWQSLIPMLANGSADIQDSLSRFDKIGFSISEADAKAADDFGDRMSDLAMIMKSFSFSIAREVTPEITPLIEDLGKWVAKNKDLIATDVKGFIRGIADGIKSINWEKVGKLVDGIGNFIDSIGGLKVALGGLLVLMNIQTIAAFLSTGSAVLRLATALPTLVAAFGAIGNAIILNPIGLIAVAIAAAAFVIYKNWEPLKKWFGETVDSMKTKFNEFSEWLKPVTDTVSGMAASLMQSWKPTIDWFSNAFGWLGDKFSAFNTWISSVDNSISGTGSRPAGAGASLVAAGQQKVGGEISVKFVDAPPGMRVENVSQKGPLAFNADVGYRSAALGMP